MPFVLLEPVTSFPPRSQPFLKGLEKFELLALCLLCPAKATGLFAKSQTGAERESTFPTQTI